MWKSGSILSSFCLEFVVQQFCSFYLDVWIVIVYNNVFIVSLADLVLVQLIVG
jgi:hypothetical protein